MFGFMLTGIRDKEIKRLGKRGEGREEDEEKRKLRHVFEKSKCINLMTPPRQITRVFTPTGCI